VPLLVQYKLITNIDTVALALYCDSYGVWQQAKERQEKAGGDGLMIKSPNGYPIQNPYLAIINRAKEDCYKYLQQFGLSPAARTRVIPAAQGILDIGEDEEKCRNYFT
jgi:P27 family predicted phage terminase small subunit